MEFLKDLPPQPVSPHIPSIPGKKPQGGGKTRRRLKIFFLSLLGLLTLILLLFAVVPFALLYSPVRALKPEVGNLQSAIAARDLEATESSLAEVTKELNRFESRYRWLVYFRFIPVVNRYYADGIHASAAGRMALDSIGTIVETIKPYEEVLGLRVGFGSQITVEQRLENLIDTLPNLVGGLDEVWENIGRIREELNQINPQRYPDEIRGVKVQFWLEEVQNILAETEPLVSRGREILEVAPALMGSPKRTYLVLFQNGVELRATGGFITGFSLLTLKNGQVLDNSFHSGAYFADHYPPELGVAPPPVRKYLNVYKWHFQDSNFFPDFPTTAKKIVSVWGKSGLPKISGVVAINTEIAADLLNVTGPIHISGYDSDLTNTGLPEDCRKGGRNFTAENLICRLEYYVEVAPHGGKGTEARKVILDLISDAIIKKVSDASAEIWPKLVDFVFKHLEEKNLLIFATASREQELLKDFGYTGELKPSAGDYLHINDSNFGGLKTNLHMQESVEQTLEKREDGSWRKTVRIKYHNPVPYDGWLSGNYKDFVRIYVPFGSKLVAVEGAIHIWTYKDQWATSIQNPSGWKENGKTVFGAYFTVVPQKEHILTFVYDLPADAVGEKDYRLLLQKQSGTNIGLVKAEIGGTMKSFDLETDGEMVIPLGE